MSRLQQVALAVSLLLFATTIPTSLHKVLNIYFQHQNQIRVAALKQALLVPTEPTLVVYILSLADPLYRDNYLYFYHEAIQRDPHATYHILARKEDLDSASLPPLPAHARYIPHDRGCGALSLVRWHLRAGPGRDALSTHNRVVLASSAVRGPFLPPSVRSMVTWHAALASELGPAVGLAGGVVSCVQPQEPRGAPGSSRRDSHTRQKGEGEGEGEGGMGEGGAGAEAGHVEELQNPFVEFTAIAATKEAVQLLLHLPDSELPNCPPAPLLTSAHAASGGGGDGEGYGDGHAAAAAAAALDPTATQLAADGLTAAEAAAMAALRGWAAAALRRGLGLAALTVRQRGVDWADRTTWACNAGVSPLADNANDGLSLMPYEAMFVPLSTADDVDMPYGFPADTAKRYSEWALQLATATAAANGTADGATLAPTNASAATTTAAAATGNGQQATTAVDSAHAAAAAAAVRRAAAAKAVALRNRYVEAGPSYRLPHVLFAVALGEACFDAQHYVQANPDLAMFENPTDVWKFWVFSGQFQPRAYRLRCGIDWGKYGLKAVSGGRKGSAAAAGATGGRPRDGIAARVGVRTEGQGGARTADGGGAGG